MNEFCVTKDRWSISDFSKSQNISTSTCWRWILKGTKGAKLATTRVGGRRYVTLESWQRFLEALNPPPMQTTMIPPPTKAEEERAAQAASARLRELGF